MLAERSGYSRKVRMVAEQNFFPNSEIELRGLAARAVNETQWIEGLAARFLRLEEVVAPGLEAQVNRGFEVPAVAHSAQRVHSASGIAIALPAVNDLLLEA